MNCFKLYILVLLLVFETSCKDDENDMVGTTDDNGFEPPQNSFVASIEGIDMNVNMLQVFSDSLRTTIIAENSETNQKLQLQLPDGLGPGSYDFSSDEQSNTATGIYYPNSLVDNFFVSESGLLSITDLNEFENIVSGNTVFTAANPTGDGVIEITFCEFSVGY